MSLNDQPTQAPEKEATWLRNLKDPANRQPLKSLKEDTQIRRWFGNRENIHHSQSNETNPAIARSTFFMHKKIESIAKIIGITIGVACAAEVLSLLLYNVSPESLPQFVLTIMQGQEQWLWQQVGKIFPPVDSSSIRQLPLLSLQEAESLVRNISPAESVSATCIPLLLDIPNNTISGLTVVPLILPPQFSIVGLDSAHMQIPL
jgi:hypothetical protein